MSDAASVQVRISLDAMGGDHGPSVVIPGAAKALERHPDTFFLLFGREAEIRAELAKFPALAARSSVHHSDIAIAMDDKPSQALRQGRYKSSMWQAIDAVKKGEAQVCVSAGNTGALMVMSRFCLKMMPGIDRPAIACMWPTARGESIVLDVGASIGAEAENLVDMAIMGSAMARIVFDIDRPTVGLLNVGVEEVKGLEQVKEAGRILREANLPNLEYRGFVEGDDIGKGTTDVVVTEGFAGNIALKTAEGTAKQIGEYLRGAIQRSLLAKIGYVFARGAFRALRHKMDPRRVNGGVFLGLDGIVVKSHGGTDALGFASAIDVAYDMVKYELLSKISHALADRGEWVLPGASSAMVEAAEGEAQSAPDSSGSHRTEGQ
ncbi:phosphate acyltransferase PlsX [Rhabdaerophilum sp. SD176]|uniref:phosphate acyltransferase PlsX n=1 Tax=Rhabdaerophilum sp. SD176 TaxID=2983548 RepID=UPI0024DFCA09|nr:phosphate acyltransferase PlsX [Rhabdaerophilum sp. SD176]